MLTDALFTFRRIIVPVQVLQVPFDREREVTVLIGKLQVKGLIKIK